MFIVEGTDGVGKTTMCHKVLSLLQEKGPWIYRHFTKLPELWRYPESYLQHMAMQVVQDRFCMSEIACREAREEKMRLSWEAYRWLDSHLRIYGAFTVLITAEESIVRDRHKQDDMHTADVNVKANEAFRKLHNFPVDIDAHLHCTECMPFPTDSFIRECVESYLKRQEFIHGVL